MEAESPEAVNGIRRIFEDYSHLALTGIACALTVLMVGGGSLVVGGIWVFWRLLDATHLPAMQLFRGAWWLFFWPGMLLTGHREEADDLAVIVLSGFGWLAALTVLLNMGKLILGRARF